MRSLLQLKLLCVSYMEIPGAELRFFSKLLPTWQLLSSCCHCQASLCHVCFATSSLGAGLSVACACTTALCAGTEDEA